MLLALTMAMILEPGPELSPMPRVANVRELIREGISRAEVERLLPKQEGQVKEYMTPGYYMIYYPKSQIYVRYDPWNKVMPPVRRIQAPPR